MSTRPRRRPGTARAIPLTCRASNRLGACLLALALPAATGAAVPADVPAAAVDAVFAAWNRADTPGCAVSVLHDGQPLHRQGHGMASLELGAPIRPDTVFYIASVSKQFTAAAIALLAEDGALALDDDVRRYVPELPDYRASVDGRPITVAHLVHHTSGLRDYLTLASLAGHDVGDSLPLARALDLIARQQTLNFAPGSEYLYSNSNYLLMALIVERVSGQSLRAFADARIFAPLGMRHTAFHDDATRIVPRRATGHTGDAQRGYAQLRSGYALVGDGGLMTSVDDLQAWERNFHANRLGKGEPGLIERLTTPARLDDGTPIDYAFGLVASDYRGLPTIAHGGSFLAYRAQMLRFPTEAFAIFVLCNADSAEPDRYAREIADLYLADRFAVPPPAPDERTGGEPAPSSAPLPDLREAARALAGDYRSAELDTTYRLRMEDDALVARAGYSAPVTWRLLDADRAEARGAQIRVRRRAGGEIEGFELDAGRVRGLRFERLHD